VAAEAAPSTTAAMVTPGGRGHDNSHTSGDARGGFDACHRIDEIRHAKGATNINNNDGFPAFSARLRALLVPKKFKPLGVSKYDVKQDPL
jgi:hypothetical protein